jgi:hypothetical protein
MQNWAKINANGDILKFLRKTEPKSKRKRKNFNVSMQNCAEIKRKWRHLKIAPKSKQKKNFSIFRYKIASKSKRKGKKETTRAYKKYKRHRTVFVTQFFCERKKFLRQKKFKQTQGTAMYGRVHTVHCYVTFFGSNAGLMQNLSKYRLKYSFYTKVMQHLCKHRL